MSTYNQRHETPLKHLFDGSELNVYEANVINLSAGTPSESLLSKCNEVFEKSTKHLLVRVKCEKSYFYYFYIMRTIKYIRGK